MEWLGDWIWVSVPFGICRVYHQWFKCSRIRKALQSGDIDEYNGNSTQSLYLVWHTAGVVRYQYWFGVTPTTHYDDPAGIPRLSAGGDAAYGRGCSDKPPCALNPACFDNPNWFNFGWHTPLGNARQSLEIRAFRLSL